MAPQPTPSRNARDMPETLTVHLVNKAGDLSGHFTAEHLKTAQGKLKAYFEEIIKPVATYNAVEVKTDSKQGDVQAKHLVCYLVPKPDDSIVAKRATKDITLGVSGSTMMGDADKAVVSEVYLRTVVLGSDPRARNATTNREQLVANVVLHELIHNLCDATTPIVKDVHKVQDGVICRETDSKPLSGTDAPNAVDNATAAAALNSPLRAKGVKQYTGDMPS